jgi:hypothetical protein
VTGVAGVVRGLDSLLFGEPADGGNLGH